MDTRNAPKHNGAFLHLVILISLLNASCGSTGTVSTPSGHYESKTDGTVSTPSGHYEGKTEKLRVFDETLAQVEKHYVDTPELGRLISASIHGMEDWLASNEKTFPKLNLNDKAIAKDKNEALGTMGSAFSSFLQASGADPKLLEYAAIKGMFKALDPHSAFMTPEMYRELQVETNNQFGGIGLQIGEKDGRLAVIAPIEGSPADKAGIRAGDYITKINNESTQNLILMEVVQRLRGPVGTKMSITLERTGEPEPLSLEVVREYVKIQSVQPRVIDEEIGYIRIKQLQQGTLKDLKQVLRTFQEQKIRGLILDLRDNPGGLLSATVEVAEQFLRPNILIASLKGRDRRMDEYVSRYESPVEKIPMAVLVNSGTGAGAEVIAGAMQDSGRAVVIGTQTFGNGTVQTFLPLADGSWMRLTTARLYTPKGQSIGAKIQPDLVVRDQEGPDAPLVSAVETLKAVLKGLGKAAS